MISKPERPVGPRSPFPRGEDTGGRVCFFLDMGVARKRSKGKWIMGTVVTGVKNPPPLTSSPLSSQTSPGCRKIGRRDNFFKRSMTGRQVPRRGIGTEPRDVFLYFYF